MVISPSCIHMLHRCTSDTQSRMAQTEVATVVAQRMRKPTVLDSAWRASAPPCVACGRAAAECRAESDFHRLSFYEATRGLEGLFTATFVSHPRNNRVSALRALQLTSIIPIGCALSLSSDLASTLYDTIYDDIS